MPVPTLVTDLSTTLASNSPAGSDNVFPDLDNYLRALSGFVASIRDNSGNGWVSPYLPLTYSAGTANGVVYLNGSKVVTTGSALVFDGTNLGLGVTPSAWGAAGQKAFQLAGLGAVSGGYDYSISASNNAMRVSGGGWQYMLTGQLASLYQQISGTHTWSTAPSGTAGNAISFTQAMTITSGGDLLVGTTTVSGAGGLTYLNQGATGFASINNNNAGATGYVFSSYRRSSTEIGSITQNGTTAVLFNTTSDRRLKQNIVPAPSASAVIDAIEIVSHDWKAAPEEHVTYGVIAQDLALVAPQAVLQGDEGDEIEKTWGVDYSKLVPMLIKEIQSLRARVAALEAA